MSFFTRCLPLLALTLPNSGAAQFFETVNGTQPGAGVEQLVYDPGRDRVVGLGDTATFEHDGIDWRSVPTTQHPGDRYEYAMAFDGHRVLVHGGGTPIGHAQPALADLWAFDGNDWTRLAANAPTGVRRGHEMAWDPVRQRLVLFGGTDMNNGFFSDTWEWDGVTWTQVAQFGPSARVWHRMTFDPVRNKVLLVGGALNPSIFNDTWEWDGTNWTQTDPGGVPARIMPALFHDRVLGKTLLIGGQDTPGTGMMGQVWAYDPASLSWSELVVPPGRRANLQQVIGGAFDTRRARGLLVTWDAFSPPATFAFRSLGSQSANYASFGQGCAGGHGAVPRLAAESGTLPTRGSTFTAEVSNVGNATAVLFGLGVSNQSWLGYSLPFSMAGLGMPGCSLHCSMDAVFSLSVGGRSGTAAWNWTVPLSSSIDGLTFYQQAVTLDATAGNGVGGVSNARAATVR